MTITSLELQNFRNFPGYKTEFSDLNIFWGKNGAGKTNLLESINFLSTFRSTRARRLLELIYFGQNFLLISAAVSKEKANKFTLSFYLDAQQRVIKVKDVPKTLSQALGILKIVLFSPEDLNLISGPPPLRRRFLNLILAQLDSHFVWQLLEFQRVLTSRNHILQNLQKGEGQEEELDFWDQKLVELGSQIIQKREGAVRFFNQSFPQIYQEIAQDTHPLNLFYQKSVERENFLEQISAFRHQEIQRGQSLYGPHRDDLILQRDSRNFAFFSSRGEQRSAILALKIAQIKFLDEKTGERPVLLLDDIFSELDSARKKALSQLVFAQQTILTSTEKENIPQEILEKAKIVQLDTQ